MVQQTAICWVKRVIMEHERNFLFRLVGLVDGVHLYNWVRIVVHFYFVEVVRQQLTGVKLSCLSQVFVFVDREFWFDVCDKDGQRDSLMKTYRLTLGGKC